MPHIYQLPSKHWRVIAKHNRQTRTGTTRTKSEAQRLGAKLLLEIGGKTDGRIATVAELVADYIAERTGRWSATYNADVIAVMDRIPDAFGRRLVSTVTPTMISGLYRQLEFDGWTTHRLRRLHEILSAAWTDGMRRGTTSENPCRVVHKPKARRREIMIPTDDEVVALLVAPSHLVERAALRLAATLGGRRGEVVALQWRDVDLARETVVIRRSLSYTKAAGVTTGDTKTGEAGHRVLTLDPVTAGMLAELHAEQVRQGADKPGPAKSPLWVISDDAGWEPWRPDRLTHVFATARKAAGVNGVRLHDLRHYVATSMLQDGEAPIDVANQLGHSDTSTTLKVYAHFLPGRGRESARKRAARLDRG